MKDSAWRGRGGDYTIPLPLPGTSSLDWVDVNTTDSGTRDSATLRAGRPGLLDHVHHDGLGRVVSVLAPDNASTATYTYADNLTTVTDPAGKWKTFTTSFTCTPGTATAG